jgi:hypothetical protein
MFDREGRKGIDVVNDNVENSLMREVDNIKVIYLSSSQVNLYLHFVK